MLTKNIYMLQDNLFGFNSLPVQHVLYKRQDRFQVLFACSSTAGRTGVSVGEPALDAHLTEHMPTRTLHRPVQHTLTYAAHEIGVRWGIKLLNVIT